MPVGSPGVSPLSLLPHWGAEEEVDNHNEGDKLSLGYFILFYLLKSVLNYTIARPLYVVEII